jgi:predicted RNA-binding Zn ribbon-like protein
MMEKRPPPMLLAGSPGLDFLNSIATPVDTPVEWIGSGKDLLEWLDTAGFVPKDVIAEFRASAVSGELDKVAAQARALREWFRSFVVKHRGKPLNRVALRELRPLNQLLSRDQEVEQIIVRESGRNHAEGASSPFELVSRRHWRTPGTLLLPIAHAIADVVCNEDFSKIGACAGTTCTLFFIDRSHGQIRRYCSSSICGNRAKQAAYRARSRKA